MLKKNLRLCFSRIKCLPTSASLTIDDEEDERETYKPEAIRKSFNFSLCDLSDDADFSAAFASRRFFVSSPGNSNSILDPAVVGLGTAVAVTKYSMDPYVDFRRSMEEMVRAHLYDHHRRAENGSDDQYGYLQELLLCYLSLNPKNTHRVIVCAFTDLLVSFFSATVDTGAAVARRRRYLENSGVL